MSEISFKSLIKNILKLADQFDCRTIGLPVHCWIERDYPSYLLARWFDESINEFLNANTNHSLTNITLVLDSERDTFLNYLSFEKTSILSRSLSRSDEYTLDELDLNSSEFKTVSFILVYLFFILLENFFKIILIIFYFISRYVNTLH